MKKHTFTPFFLLGSGFVRVFLVLFFTSISYGNDPYLATELFKPTILLEGIEPNYPSRASNPPIGYSQADGFSQVPEYTFEFKGLGRISHNRGYGSGTIIRPRSVLTAGHVVYLKDSGYVTGINFHRNLNGGPRYVPAGGKSVLSSEHSNVEVDGIRIWSSYRQAVDESGSKTYAALNNDIALIYFNTLLNGGSYSGYGVYLNEDSVDKPSLKIMIGYGNGGVYDGSKPLASWTYTKFKLKPITEWYFYNEDVRVYKGMSGGPVFQRKRGGTVWHVRGVMVTSVLTENGHQSGYRMIDTGKFNYIKASP